MKRILSFLAALTLLLAVGLTFTVSGAYAQKVEVKKPAAKGFVDANQDGINDNAKDSDGDGIPNGQDPDFVKPNPTAGQGHGFADADGDGVNDYAQDADGDGIPNGQDTDWVAPVDGSGQKKGRGKTAQAGTKGAPLGGYQHGSKGPNGEVNQVQAGRGSRGFADLDGDGINDRAQDSDGDGVPNGMDPDFERLNPTKGHGRMGYIDEDGDGINDLMQDADGDGIANGRDSDYVRPQDGSGSKLGAGKSRGRSAVTPAPGAGTAPCDGTGPRGLRGSGRQK